ncbi:MAG: transketolase C-terminal domain-containing protein [Thermodesulfovibrionales bacterium]|nr:transketolase C-terminal domain-containing protein [Thermodesulfovibrionales bacterium]
MRAAFFKTLAELYQKDVNTYVLTADLGFKLFDDIKAGCPDRFYDIGVAEANMGSISAGLSLSGKNVYCYSIIPFLIMRAFEQIRIDIAYHNLDVKLVGVGGGVTYGLEGFTHFGLEDFALMRSLPNMTIVVPADPVEAACLAKISHRHKGPMYIRLGRNNEPSVHEKCPDFQIGKPIFLSEGKHVAILAIGSMVYIGKQLLNMLRGKGITATLVNVHTLRPLDAEVIKQVASTHELIFSLEEHYVEGGLGTAIAEILAETRYNTCLKRIGVGKLTAHIGSAEYLREKYGLTADKIFHEILNKLMENS